MKTKYISRQEQHRKYRKRVPTTIIYTRAREYYLANARMVIVIAT